MQTRRIKRTRKLRDGVIVMIISVIVHPLGSSVVSPRGGVVVVLVVRAARRVSVRAASRSVLLFLGRDVADSGVWRGEGYGLKGGMGWRM